MADRHEVPDRRKMPRAPKHEWPSRLVRDSTSYAKAVEELGTAVRKLRQARKWTLEQAGEEMGFDATQIAKIEAGAVNITLVTLVRLADGFGVPIKALFVDQRRSRK